MTALPTVQCYGRWDSGGGGGVAALHGELWAVGGRWKDADRTLRALASMAGWCASAPRLVSVPAWWSSAR